MLRNRNTRQSVGLAQDKSRICGKEVDMEYILYEQKGQYAILIYPDICQISQI